MWIAAEDHASRDEFTYCFFAASEGDIAELFMWVVLLVKGGKPWGVLQPFLVDGNQNGKQFHTICGKYSKSCKITSSIRRPIADTRHDVAQADQLTRLEELASRSLFQCHDRWDSPLIYIPTLYYVCHRVRMCHNWQNWAESNASFYQEIKKCLYGKYGCAAYTSSLIRWSSHL